MNREVLDGMIVVNFRKGSTRELNPKDCVEHVWIWSVLGTFAAFEA